MTGRRPFGRFVHGWFGPLFQVRTWRETAHLLADLPIGIAFFTVAVVLVSLSAGLLALWIGVPLLMLTAAFGRAVGVAERGRAWVLLGTRLPGFGRPDLSGSLWQKVKRSVGDAPGWRGIAYSVVMLPWGIATFTLTVVFWSTSLSMAAWPLYQHWIPEDSDGGPYHWGPNYALYGWGRFGVAAGTTVVGLLLLAVTPRLVRGLAGIDRRLIKGLLSPGAQRELQQRVEELTVSRDASVEGAAVELRRIERDLHDGAQQRLVALAMDLGMARERLAGGGDADAAIELVNRAHDEAKQAITELRDLVRGIHPQVLTDRGLDAALSALAARSPVPVQVDVTLDGRPPAAIEAAAYFVVAESLANIAKHSRARRASVRVEQLGQRLLVDVRDDGVGGAVEHPGGGLSGLRDRVLGVEGALRITSPPGGPTELHVELPCAS